MNVNNQLTYVCPKIAEDLKILGFDWLCMSCYIISDDEDDPNRVWIYTEFDDYEHPYSDIKYVDFNHQKGDYCEYIMSAPKQASVVNWFDVIHKIRIFAKQSPSGLYNYEIYKWNYDNKEGIWERIGNVTHFETRELAEEAGIKKAIEILKDKENEN
jgi:hypothetical protein